MTRCIGKSVGLQLRDILRHDVLTKIMTYREWGWKIFEAFEKHTKLPNGGYAALRDVTVVPPPQDDRMDTFFLVSVVCFYFMFGPPLTLNFPIQAETLKYLYLLFGPNDIIPLDKYVFNTEAHPLPVFKPRW